MRIKKSPHQSLWALLGGAISACNLAPVEPGLTATVSGSQTGADCASCHAYPVGGVNHQFHLLHTDSLKYGNGSVTCLDCHRGSLQERDAAVLDSLYADSLGALFSAYDSGTSTSFRNAIATGKYRLSKIDTLIHHRPVPVVEPPGRFTFIQEWMTGYDHLNGVVDVKFDANNNDLARYSGKSASFDPRLETCSAVACHKNNTPYRWPAPSKGLSGLNANTTQ